MMKVVPPSNSCCVSGLLECVRLSVRVGPPSGVCRVGIFIGGTRPSPSGLEACNSIGVLTIDVCDLQGFNDTLKVGLLVFLELWLGTYPLSCGLG